ncbi:MocR-like pyridoxine biosynthesis transcription factor PdxR [Arthrobacter sp. HY1533]|uniref:MocR-like pyridoxine biosynthesis transcription factor PdxR n=1 Tax=Arthrobacter sp. HY1533 TaxID=2970919 RepID=UPI0022B9FA0B|nr:PLP-dependent aminotransferase family protein [Arthrobacter sp. HY1533]
MVKETGGRLLGDFALDRTSETPLHRQIYLQIRTHVLNGQLPGGARLPSTRTLTAELGVSRITIVNAFEELCAEGFLRSRAGDGTYVGEEWRSQFAAEPAPERPVLSARASATTSSRGSELTSHAPASWNPDDAESFVPSQVGVDAFPVRTWKRLLARHGERRDVDMLGYGDPFGHRPLREAIADYLNDARGIGATAEQVVICTGAQQAFNALALLMVDSGDEVWMEDPGHIAARLAFLANGCTVRGIPIDADGADLAAGAALHKPGRLMFVTPSRQHPLGVSMSLGRRMEWIKWANENNSWIIEDDCDSELRYRGPLMPTLFGLDRSQHVIHVGTFSKIMFPSLRIGYAVLPTDLVEPFKAAVQVIGRTPSTLLQAVATDFIREGHLHAHIRRTRRLYLARQDALLAALRDQLHPFITAEPVDAGMHVIGWLPEHVDDQLLAAQLADRGIYTYALGDYYLDGGGRPALLIGFAATGEAHMPQAVSHMVRALHHIGHIW